MAHRITRLVFAASLLALAFPAAAVAAPPEGSCGAETSIAHTMPIPADMRTAGVHRYERWWIVTRADGSVEDWGTFGSYVEMTMDAPRYENALVRVVSTWGLRADGTIDRPIFAIRPDQPGAFYSQTSWLKTDSVVAVKQLLRYEIRKNRWSPWIEVPAGPAVSYCVEESDAVIKKSYGWAG